MTAEPTTVLWGILAAGAAIAAALGLLAVLILMLHTEVKQLRRLVLGQTTNRSEERAGDRASMEGVVQTAVEAAVGRAAAGMQESVRTGLKALLERALESGAARRPALPELVKKPAPPPPPLPPPSEPAVEFLETERGATQLAANTAAEETAPANGWSSERRTLIARLAERGEEAGQIASTLRIPHSEVELFLNVNRLRAVPQPAGLPEEE